MDRIGSWAGTSGDPGAPAEEMEQIPWAALQPPSPPRWHAVARIAAGALVVAALAGLVARSVWRPQPATVVVTPTSVEQSIPTVAVEDHALIEPATQTTVASAAPVVWSEADLMAPATDQPEMVVARAEWFVTDYFTADGAPDSAHTVRRSLPEGLTLPPLVQDERTAPASYVEWARALRTAPLGDQGVVLVEVALRRLVAEGEGGYRRLPVEVVAVPVGPDGTVLDLPAPVSQPDPVIPTAPKLRPGEPPTAVLAAARKAARGFGSGVRLLSTESSGEMWRVVLEVKDGTGQRWPLVMWVDGEGVPGAPPAG